MTTATLSLDTSSARRRLQGLVSLALMRLRLQEALNASILSGTIVLWLLVPMVFFDKLFSLSSLGFNVWVLWGCLVALCLPYILIRTFSPRINHRLAAVLTDERLGLNSRLCTALALNPDDHSGFNEAFYAEAADSLASLDPQRAFPIHTPKLAYLMPLPGFLSGALVAFMPDQDKLGFKAEAEQVRLAEAVKKSSLKKFSADIEDLKKDELEDVPPDSAQYKVKQLVKKAENIARQVKEGKRDPEDAIIAVADLKREIGEERERMLEGKDFMSRLKNISAEELNLEENDFTREISKALKEGDPSMAARQMRKLARKLKQEILENENMTAEQKEAALKKVQREMEKLAGALAEQEALKNNLQEISQKAMEAGEFEAMQENIKDFQKKNGGKDAEKLAEDLEEMMDDAADEMEQLEDENENELDEDEQEAEQDMEDLEESLDELMEGLNSSCQGGQSSEGGKKSGASSGRSAKGKQKSGRSGKSGSGKKGRSGRKGMAGDGNKGNKKGQQGGPSGQQGGNRTTGGAGVNEVILQDGDVYFKVQRVRGKLQSGAITGLSHFRGQGAKGDAPTEYIEALSAAEQKATSSLELDRIPADARNMVKAYFSKLRKDTHSPAPAVAPTPAGSQPKTFDGTKPLKE